MAHAGIRQFMRQVILFCLAAASLIPAASAKTLQLPAHTTRNRAWVLSDMNGDKIADMAAAGPGRIDDRGYSREVSVHIAGAGKSRFTVRTQSAGIQLSLRDIDGDHDRDLVILEPWSLEPIGIWLNDGEGNFEEGNVSLYRRAIGRREPRSFASSPQEKPTQFALHHERTARVAPVCTGQTPVQTRALLLAEYHPQVLSRRQSGASPRAPPALF